MANDLLDDSDLSQIEVTAADLQPARQDLSDIEVTKADLDMAQPAKEPDLNSIEVTQSDLDQNDDNIVKRTGARLRARSREIKDKLNQAVMSTPQGSAFTIVKQIASGETKPSDIGLSLLAGGSGVKATVGGTLRTSGDVLGAVADFQEQHPRISKFLEAGVSALPGGQLATAIPLRKVADIEQSVGKASQEMFTQEAQEMRDTRSERARNDKSLQGQLVDSVAEAIPQLAADYITGRAGMGLLGEASAKIPWMRTAVSSVVEGNTAGSQQRAQVEQQVDKLSDDQLRSVPMFQSAITEAGGDLTKARGLVKEKLGRAAYAQSALTTSLTSLALGGTLEKWILAGDTGKLAFSTYLKRMGLEATEEGAQSAFDQVGQNFLTGKKGSDLLEGVGEAAGIGALAGSVLAGGFTAGQHLAVMHDTATTTKDLVKNHGLPETVAREISRAGTEKERDDIYWQWRKAEFAGAGMPDKVATGIADALRAGNRPAAERIITDYHASLQPPPAMPRAAQVPPPLPGGRQAKAAAVPGEDQPAWQDLRDADVASSLAALRKAADLAGLNARVAAARAAPAEASLPGENIVADTVAAAKTQQEISAIPPAERRGNNPADLNQLVGIVMAGSSMSVEQAQRTVARMKPELRVALLEAEDLDTTKTTSSTADRSVLTSPPAAGPESLGSLPGAPVTPSTTKPAAAQQSTPASTPQGTPKSATEMTVEPEVAGRPVELTPRAKLDQIIKTGENIPVTQVVTRSDKRHVKSQGYRIIGDQYVSPQRAQQQEAQNGRGQERRDEKPAGASTGTAGTTGAAGDAGTPAAQAEGTAGPRRAAPADNRSQGGRRNALHDEPAAQRQVDAFTADLRQQGDKRRSEHASISRSKVDQAYAETEDGLRISAYVGSHGLTPVFVVMPADTVFDGCIYGKTVFINTNGADTDVIARHEVFHELVRRKDPLALKLLALIDTSSEAFAEYRLEYIAAIKDSAGKPDSYFAEEVASDIAAERDNFNGVAPIDAVRAGAEDQATTTITRLSDRIMNLRQARESGPESTAPPALKGEAAESQLDVETSSANVIESAAITEDGGTDLDGSPDPMIRFTLSSKVLRYMDSMMGGASPQVRKFASIMVKANAMTVNYRKWLKSRTPGYKTANVHTMQEYLDEHRSERVTFEAMAKELGADVVDFKTHQLKGLPIEDLTKTDGNAAMYEAIRDDDFLSDNYVGNEYLKRLTPKRKKTETLEEHNTRVTEGRRRLEILGRKYRTTPTVDAIKAKRDDMIRRIVSERLRSQGIKDAQKIITVRDFATFIERANQALGLEQPQFGGFHRSFNQFLVDRMPADKLREIRTQFYNAVRHAYEAGTAKKVNFMFTTWKPENPKQRRKSTGVTKGVEKVWKTGDLAVSLLKGAKKTMAALNGNVACPMFIVGNSACWLNACYLTQMAAAPGGLAFYEYAPYTGELLQLPQFVIDQLNRTGGLRINGLGDFTPSQREQFADILRDAKDRGLRLKMITKQAGAVRTIQAIAATGQDVSHVTVQPSMDFLWIPVDVDINTPGSGAMENIFKGMDIEDAQAYARRNPEAVAEAYRTFYDREAKVIDGQLMRKYGFSADQVKAIAAENPAVRVLPRWVVTTPQEVAEATRIMPGTIYTLMHGKVDERVVSELPGGGFVNFGDARHQVNLKSGVLHGRTHGKNQRSVKAYSAVNDWIHANYSPADQKTIYEQLKKGACCQENQSADACYGCAADCAMCRKTEEKWGKPIPITNDTAAELGDPDATSGEPGNELDREQAKTIERYQAASRQRNAAAVDAEYLAAVEAGDMAKAQRMVDEAAKAAGYNIGPVYHGTEKAGFTTFTTQGASKKTPKGAFFTGSRRGASSYAGSMQSADIGGDSHRGIYSAYLKMDDPKVVDAKGANWDSIIEEESWRVGDEFYYTREEADAAALATGEEVEDASFPVSTDELASQTADQVYDGIHIKNVSDEGSHGQGYNWDSDIYVVYDPSQIKSADPVTRDDAGNVIPLSERFNSATPDIRFQAADRRESPAPTFFSQLRRVIEQKMPNRATVAVVRNIIDPGKGSGVKQDEIVWTGLEEFLTGKSGAAVVTKDEVLAAVKDVELMVTTLEDATPVEVSDEMKSWLDQNLDGRTVFSSYEWDDIASQLANTVDRDGSNTLLDLSTEAEQHARDTEGSDGTTKFSNWQLPGGTNYREVLVTLPTKRLWQNGSPVTAEDLATRYGREAADRSAVFIKEPFKSSHWQQPNVLVHFRLNDREVDGKRILHIEEIQSDWHQQGRDKGYAPSKPITITAVDLEIRPSSSYRPSSFGLFDKNSGRLIDGSYVGMEAAEAALRDWVDGKQSITFSPEEFGSSLIPAAPFSDTSKGWARLAFKRILREAAEGGYDAVTWTTGEQQADRYDLSKQIDSVAWNQDKGELVAMKANRVVLRENAKQDQLADYIGKEGARKLLEQPAVFDDVEGGQVRRLKNADLKVGGEGMAMFYDRIVPSIANDIGKRFGARVETMDLPVAPKDYDRAVRDGSISTEDYKQSMGTERVHSLPITEAMADSVLYDGQPKFQAAGSRSQAKPQAKVIDKADINSQPAEDAAIRSQPMREVEPRYSIVVSQQQKKRLDAEKKIKAFRAMQLIDGKLYPPMSAKVDGQLRPPTKIGQWEQAVEQPELADDHGHFKLDKGNQKSIKARYNPYFHASRSPLNDQFSEAYNRPNLITVEVEIPESELTSGYRAEKAKDSVGEKSWNSGPVSTKLPDGKKRKVILSRWAKVVRVVPDGEVADNIARLLDGEGITIPSNVVTPSLRDELTKRGVKVDEEPRYTIPSRREDIAYLRDQLERERRIYKPRAIQAAQAFEGAAVQAKADKTIERLKERQKQKLAERTKALRELRSKNSVTKTEVKRKAIELGKDLGTQALRDDVIEMGLLNAAREAIRRNPRGKGSSPAKIFKWMTQAAEVLDSTHEDVEDARKKGASEKDLEEAVRVTLKPLLGGEYTQIRRVSLGQPTKTLGLLRARLNQILLKKYGKQLNRMLRETKVDDFYVSPTDPQQNFRNKWLDYVAEMNKMPATERQSMGWAVTKRWWEQGQEIIADSRNARDLYFDGRRMAEEDLVFHATDEMKSAPWAKRLGLEREKNRGFWKTAFVDKHASSKERSLLLSGGLDDGFNSTIHYNDLAKGESSKWAMMSSITHRMDKVYEKLGIKDTDRIDMMTKRRKVMLGGVEIELTPAQVITIVALSKRPDAARKMRQNGIVREEEYGLEDSTRKGNIDEISRQATPQEQAIADAMVDELTAMGTPANEITKLLSGKEEFNEAAYFPMRADITQKDSPKLDTAKLIEESVSSYTTRTLEDLGIRKETVRHQLPLIIGNAFNIFDRHIDKMSSFIHLTMPIRTTLRVLGHPMYSAAMNTIYGTAFRANIREMLERLAGLSSYTDGHSDLLKFWEKIASNSSVAILAYRPTTYAFNRIGGSVMIWAELMKTDPKLAAAYVVYNHPIFLSSKASKEALAAMERNGYLHKRWNQDLSRLFIQIAQDEKWKSTTTNLRWKKLQNHALTPMANAEKRNAIVLFTILRASGMSVEAAVDRVAEITRRTQNPTSALDESGYIEDFKSSGFGGVFPFMGQPTVVGNNILGEIIRLKGGHGSTRSLVCALVGMVLSSVLTAAVRRLVNELAGRGGKKTTGEKNLDSLAGIATEYIDIFLPGSGAVLDGIAGAISRGKFEMRSMQFEVFSKLLAGARIPLDLAEDKMEKAGKDFRSLLNGILSVTGAPVGGVEQIFGVAKGIATGKSFDSKYDNQTEIIKAASSVMYVDEDRPMRFGRPVTGQEEKYQELVERWQDMTGGNANNLAYAIRQYRAQKRLAAPSAARTRGDEE
jgi:hypothetical protein